MTSAEYCRMGEIEDVEGGRGEYVRRLLRISAESMESHIQISNLVRSAEFTL